MVELNGEVAMADNSSGKGWNPLGSVVAILTILMAAASLISLIQRWSGVEIISEIAQDALSLYRQMIEQIQWALFGWWTPIELPWGWVFEMPTWGMDVLALFVLQLGALFRSLSVDRRRGALWARRYPVQYGFSLLPLIGYLVAVMSLFRENLSYRDAGIWLAYLSPFLATFLFFLWNAIQITPQ